MAERLVDGSPAGSERNSAEPGGDWVTDEFPDGISAVLGSGHTHSRFEVTQWLHTGTTPRVCTSRAHDTVH